MTVNIQQCNELFIPCFLTIKPFHTWSPVPKTFGKSTTCTSSSVTSWWCFKRILWVITSVTSCGLTLIRTSWHSEWWRPVIKLILKYCSKFKLQPLPTTWPSSIPHYTAVVMWTRWWTRYWDSCKHTCAQWHGFSYCIGSAWHICFALHPAQFFEDTDNLVHIVLYILD